MRAFPGQALYYGSERTAEASQFKHSLAAKRSNWRACTLLSARALQIGFRRFRNTTPMGYPRAVRLALARTELARGGQGARSVAAVANALEFAHLGRFARDYKARFGEPPSQTLRHSDVAG